MLEFSAGDNSKIKKNIHTSRLREVMEFHSAFTTLTTCIASHTIKFFRLIRKH